MGNQQLLLTVLAMVLLGIAITVGITMFKANAIELSRGAIIEDLLFLAGAARTYYWKPTYLGGGGRDFRTVTSIGKISRMTENENGVYSIGGETTKDLIVIIGKGKIVADNGEMIEVKMKVNEQTSIIEIVN